MNRVDQPRTTMARTGRLVGDVSLWRVVCVCGRLVGEVWWVNLERLKNKGSSSNSLQILYLACALAMLQFRDRACYKYTLFLKNWWTFQKAVHCRLCSGLRSLKWLPCTLTRSPWEFSLYREQFAALTHSIILSLAAPLLVRFDMDCVVEGWRLQKYSIQWFVGTWCCASIRGLVLVLNRMRALLGKDGWIEVSMRSFHLFIFAQESAL